MSLAHRIKSGKGTEEYIRKYIIRKHNKYLTKRQIDEIIDSRLNLVTACRGKCNDSFNTFNNPEARDKLIDEIWNFTSIESTML